MRQKMAAFCQNTNPYVIVTHDGLSTSFLQLGQLGSKQIFYLFLSQIFFLFKKWWKFQYSNQQCYVSQTLAVILPVHYGWQINNISVHILHAGTQQKRSRVSVIKLQGTLGTRQTLSGFRQYHCCISSVGIRNPFRNQNRMHGQTHQRGGELRTSTLKIFNGQSSVLKSGKRDVEFEIKYYGLALISVFVPSLERGYIPPNRGPLVSPKANQSRKINLLS